MSHYDYINIVLAIWFIIWIGLSMWDLSITYIPAIQLISTLNWFDLANLKIQNCECLFNDEMIFFLSGIHSIYSEQPLQGVELQEKEIQRDKAYKKSL